MLANDPDRSKVFGFIASNINSKLAIPLFGKQLSMNNVLQIFMCKVINQAS